MKGGGGSHEAHPSRLSGGSTLMAVLALNCGSSSVKFGTSRPDHVGVAAAEPAVAAGR